MVGASVRGGMSSNAEVSALSIKRANDFCAGKGKNMLLTTTQNSGVRGWTPQESQIQFQCLEDSDPAYHRVQMRKEADTTIRVEK